MEQFIRIRGAREHNLKNIDVDIPRDRLVVFTGISGSGKSSLAFDTIYAEGQRRYVESLSSYARMFLGQMQKPDIDQIDGLSPAIAIDQKTSSRNPRSTVGTVTEIYDYLRLLYARVGHVHCPKCGKLIEQQSIDQILDRVLQYPEGTRIIVMAPVVRGRKGEFGRQFEKMRKDGFVRVRIDGKDYELAELEDDFRLDKQKKHTVSVVIDRLVKREGMSSRLADSLEVALNLAEGLVLIEFQIPEGEGYRTEEQLFSQNFSCPDCVIDIGEISPRLFSFNNPYGACPECSGLGELSEIDPDLLIDNENLSLNDGAITAAGWNFADRTSWGRSFIEALSKHYQFSLDIPWKDLPEKIKQLVLYGNDGEIIQINTENSKYAREKPYFNSWVGVVNSINKRYLETGSDDMKAYYEKYFSVSPCPSCQGDRLKKEALAVRIGGMNISELCRLPIQKCLDFLHQLELSEYQKQVAAAIKIELDKRLGFLVNVGLDYLSLGRASATLSGGEAQRIRLATQIGSGLTGVLYILDEPSIGLHQRDNARLIATLKKLRDLGNTVLVVEHDEETIWEADFVVDIGPGAGELGGKLIASGTPDEISRNPDSLTGLFLAGLKSIPMPEKRRSGNGHSLRFKGCRQNNLKNVDLSIPLGLFVCVTGVSGSGKSSFVNGIVQKKLSSDLNRSKRANINVDSVEGIEHLDKLISIDQSPIGRTPRSNPATYTGLFDLIRQLFAATKEAKGRGYGPGRFSFNVKGGRCEACKGDGVNCIEMHFLPDVYVTCEVCKGKRYNRETLEVEYKGKNIADVLQMTVDEALEFFQNLPRLARKLQTLQEVGLGYVRLGQPSTQLSGGEAQRVKLATELSKQQSGNTLYILDEPTTGLHSADVCRLVDILQRLTENGNTVLVIEHNLDVIKTADYIIDLGPEGGEAGGQLVASGTPEEVAEVKESHTGYYLKQILQRTRAQQSLEG